MDNIIIKIEKNSIAEELGIEPGDVLESINSQPVTDVFDYRFIIQNEYIKLGIKKKSGQVAVYEIEKDEACDLGIVFESGLMDKAKSCANKCIFCFIDQLPKNMRQTLYFKDDDSRLSFLSGNYVTLTNMSEVDLDRIIYYHLSPINISIHTTDPELRVFMLKNPKAANVLEQMERLNSAGIQMNFQIVLVKGVNDKERLDKTIADLVKYIDKQASLSVVPVGITKHRDGLFLMEPFTKEDCISIIKQVEGWQRKFLSEFKTRFVYAADELYIKGGLTIPNYEAYEDFPQIENGVGMIALMAFEFTSAIKKIKIKAKKKHISVVTSIGAFDFINGLAGKLKRKFAGLEITVYAVENNFFGEHVTVSGLLTGGDIINQLKDKSLGDLLLIPANCLRADTTVLLDDITIEQMEARLNVKIKPVKINGRNFIEAVIL